MRGKIRWKEAVKLSVAVEGSLVGKDALIGDVFTWFAFCVIAGIVGICFMVALYTIQGGKEKRKTGDR